MPVCRKVHNGLSTQFLVLDPAQHLPRIFPGLFVVFVGQPLEKRLRHSLYPFLRNAVQGVALDLYVRYHIAPVRPHSLAGLAAAKARRI